MRCFTLREPWPYSRTGAGFWRPVQGPSRVRLAGASGRKGLCDRLFGRGGHDNPGTVLTGLPTMGIVGQQNIRLPWLGRNSG